MNKFDIHQHCAVPMCQNRESVLSNNSNNVLFHKFPSDIKALEKWMKFCNGPDNKNKSIADYQNARICSNHFHKDNYEQISDTEVKYI